MVDLGGYVIILVETRDKRVRLYGSPAEKADLEVADEILEINGSSLENSSHTEVIAHIHNCIKSRTICLRVKRRTGNKLAKELSENSHVQDAFVIAVEQQAKERLEKLSALRKIKPVDMTKLSQQLCDSPPTSEADSVSCKQPNNSNSANVYSAPVSELGSTANLSKEPKEQQKLHQQPQRSKGKSFVKGPSDGYLTDEELELHQTLQDAPVPSTPSSTGQQPHAQDAQGGGEDKANGTRRQQSRSTPVVVAATQAENASVTMHASPSKEVLIADSSRRSSRASIHNSSCNNNNGINKKGAAEGAGAQKVHNADRKTSIKNGQEHLRIAEEEAKKNNNNRKAGHLHKPLAPTPSLKAVIDSDQMGMCVSRLRQNVSISPSALNALTALLHQQEFVSLLKIHNTIQAVQCFQCPPVALCSDVQKLVRECTSSLRTSVLPEAVEVLQILQRIDLENIFYAHDKLAQRQNARPWEKCLAEMWTKDRTATVSTSSSSGLSESATVPDNNLSESSTLPSKAKVQQQQNRAPLEEEASKLPGTAPGVAIQKKSPARSVNAPARDVTRVVKIMKQNEPLGATVRNEGERVVIGRVVKGGAAERSGQLRPGDEVLEVNGLKLKGKSVHDICDTLCQASASEECPPNDVGDGARQAREAASNGPDNAPASVANPASEEVLHYRAHFNYEPDDDLYIPCHELGIAFQRGDILHVINREDPHWWQAYRDGEWTQTLAGLIPSLALQEHRLALQRQKREQDLKEQRELERNSPARKKSGSNAGVQDAGSPSSSLLCARKTNKRKRMGSPFKKAERFDVPPYEEMSLYNPQPNQRRPLILVGPPSIGRHELRLRLLEDVNRFAAAVPHTTRSRGEGEIDGSDYNFVSRSQFEEYVAGRRFVEHGEFDRQLYGTSLDSVRTVINSGKICVLNLQPASLQILHDSDIKPYVVFLTPPSVQTYRQIKARYGGDAMKEEEYRDSIAIATDMEDHYGHYFDSVIPFDSVDYVYEQLIYEINLLEREPQWVPTKWVRTPLAVTTA